MRDLENKNKMAGVNSPLPEIRDKMAVARAH